jgi:hypothetical protein
MGEILIWQSAVVDRVISKATKLLRKHEKLGLISDITFNYQFNIVEEKNCIIIKYNCKHKEK